MVRVYICKFSEAEMFDDEKVIDHDFNNEVLKIVSKKVDKEGSEDDVQVIDVPEHFRYQEDPKMKKKAFTVYMKQLVKNTLAKIKEEGASEDEVKSFMEQMKAFVPFLLKKFDNISFYLNEKPGDNYGHPGIGVYVNDADSTPTFYYIKRALRVEKC